MNKHKITEIFRRLQQLNPKPTTELIYHSTFELLIAVMLSAQATDVSVNKATDTLFKCANTPEQLLKLGEAGLIAYIKTIGLYNAKAKNIIKTCERLINHFHSQVPSSREDLETLPGVGRKTANVILNTAFGQPTIAVDTHIFRVCKRIKLATGTTPLAIEKKLLAVMPRAYVHDAHHWLILHGRYICTARKPHCGNCPIADLCEYENKNYG